MIKERKAPKDWTTWEDFANCYDLVLFNNCTDLVHKDNTSYFEGVISEWLGSHSENCEAEHARARITELETNKQTNKQTKKQTQRNIKPLYQSGESVQSVNANRFNGTQ